MQRREALRSGPVAATSGRVPKNLTSLLAPASELLQAFGGFIAEGIAKTLAETALHRRGRRGRIFDTTDVLRSCRHGVQQPHVAGRGAKHEPRIADLDYRHALLVAQRRTADDLHHAVPPSALQAELAGKPRAAEHKRDHDHQSEQRLQHRADTQRGDGPARANARGNLSRVVDGVHVGGACLDRHKRCGGCDQAFHRFNFRMRSEGVMMSVRRIPNLSLTTTTSPCAIRQPLTSTSMGSPARPSSSTTEPCASCSKLRMAIFVRPSSTVICTGISRIISMSLRVAATGGTFDNDWNTPAEAATAGASLPFCSASALAQSSISRSASLTGSAGAAPCSVTSLISTFLHRVGCADHLLHAQRVLTIENSVAAFHHRYAVYFCRDQLGHIDWQDIAGLHVENLFEGRADLREIHRHLDFGCLNLLRQHAHPAAIDFERFALDRR